MGYKILTIEQYETEGLQVVSVEEGGAETFKSKWQLSYPKARHSFDGTEVVLSNAGGMTKQETLDYINTHWIIPDVETM